MRHLLITISDLQSLTDAELKRLEAKLRHILETALDLTDAERANIKDSLVAIHLEQEFRRSPRVISHANQKKRPRS